MISMLIVQSLRRMEFEKLQKDSVPENILKRRYEELLQMEQRLQQYGQEVQQKLAMAEQEEMIAIIFKYA